MKILLIGNGGRENAIAWKIYNSESFKKSGGKIYTTTGNPGTDKYSEAINISYTEIKKLIEFSEKEKIEFVIVGPEIPLSMGIVDEFQEKKIKIFGPTKSAAEIESSKIFAKKLMEENNIPTAGYKNFSVNEIDNAIKFISECNFPLVFKADGLAAGKGVMIANNKRESEEIIRDFSEGNTVNEAGFNFIIEEYLDGEEVSVFAICDGENFILLPFSQDHKKINDGETRKNTGGMGAVAPIIKFMTKDITEKIENKIVKPVLKAMTEAGREFKGCLFCGLMIVKGEPFVIEFNCRFGDPETQAVLPLIKSDFLEMLLKAGEKDIKNYKLETNDYNV
ncbi:MAG: phosphoribosylamine--glycine ligase, partial [Ignavibacteria bacterium]|nr:phosphoribosylamine--glycine ligase [Ignavibacteria bacterium]